MVRAQEVQLWPARPISWQGWVLTIAYVAIAPVAFVASVAHSSHQPVRSIDGSYVTCRRPLDVLAKALGSAVEVAMGAVV